MQFSRNTKPSRFFTKAASFFALHCCDSTCTAPARCRKQQLPALCNSSFSRWVISGVHAHGWRRAVSKARTSEFSRIVSVKNNRRTRCVIIFPLTHLYRTYHTTARGAGWPRATHRACYAKPPPHSLMGCGRSGTRHGKHHLPCL